MLPLHSLLEKALYHRSVVAFDEVEVLSPEAITRVDSDETQERRLAFRIAQPLDVRDVIVARDHRSRIRSSRTALAEMVE
jgi:hypothetical protein